MKLETYLSALVKVAHLTYESNPEVNVRLRQYRVFRARILRMDTKKDAEIEELKGRLAGVDGFIHMMEGPQ